MFLHGDADGTLCLEEHSLPMAKKLKAAGVKAEMKILSGVDHGFGYGVATPAQQVSIQHAEEFLAGVFNTHDSKQ